MKRPRSESLKEIRLLRKKKIMSGLKELPFFGRKRSNAKPILLMKSQSQSGSLIGRNDTKDQVLEDLIDCVIKLKMEEENKERRIRYANLIWKELMSDKKSGGCLSCISSKKSKKVTFFESEEFIYIQNESGGMDKYIPLTDIKKLDEGKEVKLHGPIQESH
uniref:Transcriptional unit 1 n=1 Tax=Suncus murinus rhabdovirus TaxID=3139574 RepID=A0AB38ZKC3_9RHAB